MNSYWQLTSIFCECGPMNTEGEKPSFGLALLYNRVFLVSESVPDKIIRDTMKSVSFESNSSRLVSRWHNKESLVFASHVQQPPPRVLFGFASSRVHHQRASFPARHDLVHLSRFKLWRWYLLCFYSII